MATAGSLSPLARTAYLPRVDSLAQVNREIEHPKVKNLKRAGFVIVVYSLVFTALVSFFATAIIPDADRPHFYDNLISGLAMHVAGPLTARLLFQGFVVVVGFLMLAGAVDVAVETGDTNGDLKTDATDVICLFGYLYLGGRAPAPLASCAGRDAAVRSGDVNGDGSIDLCDGMQLLGWLFLGGSAPAPACGGGGGAANENPRIVPIHATPHGRSYGEWGAAWWNWAASVPKDRNPVADATGEFCAVCRQAIARMIAQKYGLGVPKAAPVRPISSEFR